MAPDLSNVIEIDDPDDPRIDDYRDIRDKELRGRDAFGGLFIAEQALVVERMLSRPGVARSVLVATTHVERIAPRAGPGVPVYVAPLALLREIAGFNIHRGVLGVGRRDAVERAALEIPPPPEPVTILAADEVTNVDNIGLLFRNAAAFGADGMLLSPTCHDPLYRKSLRVSIGHALAVPFARSHDLAAVLGALKRRGLTVIGAATGAGARPLDEIDPPRRLVLVVGQEYQGLSPEAIGQCDHLVRIPMAPGVDSLNVAAAAAVCLHRLSTGHRA